MQREGESYKLLTCQSHKRQDQLDPPTLSPSPTVFLWWEHWQRFEDNWKLQSTESNYPEQDFPNILQCGVVLFVWSMCPCFRNILPCLCPHIQPVFCLPPLCFHSLNATRAWRDTVSRVCLFTLEDWMVEAKEVPGSFLILWQWCHCQQSEQQRSVIITKDNNGELSCAALPQVNRSSSDVRQFFLPKMCPPALMGCWILILLHNKMIWAFILFRKQHSSFKKAFRVSL